MNNLKKFIVLCFLFSTACNSTVPQSEEFVSCSDAQHLLTSVRTGVEILDVETENGFFTIDFAGDSTATYSCSDIPFYEVESDYDFRVESLSGHFDYSLGHELLQVVADTKAIYLFLADGTVLSSAFGKSRPTMLSVFDPERFLKKSGLKVLDIGNSYTDDALAMIPELVESMNIDVSDMCLYKLIRGGSSFRSWVNHYYGKDADVCNLTRVVGGLHVSCSEGEGKSYDSSLMRDVLTNEKWDLILIHQISNYAPYYSIWNSETDSGGLNELISILRYTQPQAAIGTLLVHSYMSGYSNNTEKTSEARWRQIAMSTYHLCSNYGIGYVIPYGTAVENLRKVCGKQGNGHGGGYDRGGDDVYGFTRDGLHLGVGLARYTSSCCYYESLFGPRTGTSVKGCGLRYTCPPDITIFKYPEGCVNVTGENAGVAQMAAIAAVKKRYELVEP